MAGLILKNVNKVFPGGQMAVRDFSLEIKNREFIILSGPAGCGKSTLLRMIAGLEEISSGSLFIDGKDMTHADPKDRNIAMVFKNSVLYPEMTVAGNLSFALRMAKLPQAEIEERIEDIAGFLKIERILDKQSEELSMEERYRVLLGRALMRRPGILLLDSTIADLKESLQEVLRREFSKVCKKMDMTVIYVTDNQKTAMALATRMVVMDDGEICQEGSPKELVEYPINRFVARVAGFPPMNFFTAAVFNENGRIGLKNKSGKTFLSEKTSAALENGRYIGKEVIFGIRADRIHICTDQNAENGCFQAKFSQNETREPLNGIRFLMEDTGALCLEGQELSMRPGEKIKISMEPDQIYVFDKETEKMIR